MFLCQPPRTRAILLLFHLLIIVVLHVYELLPVYEFCTIESSCVDVFILVSICDVFDSYAWLFSV